MKAQAQQVQTDKGKIFAIYGLYTFAAIIAITGVIFSIYSLINNVSFPVLNTNIPGVVFGLVVTFLGVRYFLSVNKLKSEVYKKSSKFSWSNFKKDKKSKKSK